MATTKKATVSSTEIFADASIGERLQQMVMDKRSLSVGVAAPYINRAGSAILAKMPSQARASATAPVPDRELQVLVSIEVEEYVFGSSDPAAIDEIMKLRVDGDGRVVSLRHLPHLHAKIFVCDGCGLVGSANLTHAGLRGGNFEVAAGLHQEEDVLALRKQFDALWNRGRTVTPELWAVRKKQIDTLTKKFGKELKRIREGIRNERVALERMPDAKNQADYYEKLLNSLSWVQDGPGESRAPIQLIQHLRRANEGVQISRELAEKRIAFIREIGLIAQRRQRWRLTSDGKRLGNNAQSRWWLFGKLLRWCEERGDEQFRVLLQAIDANTSKKTPELSLTDWCGAIPRADSVRWWEGAGRDYDRFCRYSCQARNWLVSLEVLTREERGSFYYRRGGLYRKLKPAGAARQPFDARLNDVIQRA